MQQNGGGLTGGFSASFDFNNSSEFLQNNVPSLDENIIILPEYGHHATNTPNELNESSHVKLPDYRSFNKRSR